MTLKIRVIPVLLWDGKQAVQSTHFKRPHRPVGSFMQYIENYENRDIDELVILDVEASREGHEPLFEDIKEFTSKIYAPVAVGGGIRTLEHVAKMLKAGADKVIINTALYKNPEFVYQAVRKFGAQAITASINNVYDHGNNIICNSDGTETQGASTRNVCKYAYELGVGEILLTDSWLNGTRSGFNLELITECTYKVPIPIIAYGGCGQPSHMVDALIAGANAVAASSMFLFTDVTPRDCSIHINEKGFAARIT